MNSSSYVCKIDAYPDTDFAGMYGREEYTDPACAKSWNGFIIAFADCPVLWQSKLQTETALSTMEAKIIALPACSRELFPILVGKSTWNSGEFCNYSDSGPFELRNFHRNFIF